MARKKQLWRIREELEKEIKLLRRGRLEAMGIIATMLKIGIDKGGFTKYPIMKTNLTSRVGNHSPSTVDYVFVQLSKYGPKILKPAEEDSPYYEGKDSCFTEEARDIFDHDIRIYKELDKHNLLKESERTSIQMIDKRLHEFYGF